jgi:four helix bundle protein
MGNDAGETLERRLTWIGERKMSARSERDGNGLDRDIEALKERMKQFGVAIIRLVERFPAGRVAGIVSGQMVRSGTSVGANYRAACRARSRADFIAKLGIVEEELDETLYWLEVSLAIDFVVESDVERLIGEGDELLAIVVASIRTAKRKP